MLVIEHRNHTLAVGKSIGDFFEKPFAGIKMLAEFVPWIFTMLTDAQDAIDGDLVAPERDRFSDRFAHAEAMFLRELYRKIFFRKLVDIKRNQF